MKKLLRSFLICFMLTGLMHAQDMFTVYFDFDVDEAANASGKKLSQWIASHKDIQVLKVHGFADATGNAAYNVNLLERRAAYVAAQFQQGNVEITNIEVKGYGATQATGNDMKDRKVIIYYKVRKQPVAEKPKPESDFTKTVTTAAKGDKIRVPNLNFYNNSDIILPQSRPVMRELFQILINNPALKIDIQGHICCQLNEENQISHLRALAVYNLLIKNGIDKSRLFYKSFGSTKPIHPLPEKNEAQRIDNRRVEIEILDN